MLPVFYSFALILAGSALADWVPRYIGCYPSKGAIDDTANVPSVDPASYQDCAIYCRTDSDHGGPGEFPYAYWIQSGVDSSSVTNICVCSLHEPAYYGGNGPEITAADQPSCEAYANTNAGDGDNANEFGSVAVTRSTFSPTVTDGKQCYTSLTGTSLASKDDIGQADCFNFCKAYTTAAWSDATASGCQCYNGVTPNGPVDCGTGTYWTWTHPADASISNMARRRLRESLVARKKRNASKLCPRGLTACKTSPSVDDYECLDVSSELESCGGCLYGEYGLDKTDSQSTLGVDCSSINAPMGFSTCSQGRCVSSACHKGYVLVQGDCVRK